MIVLTLLHVMGFIEDDVQFTKLYRKYRGTLYNFIFKMIGDDEITKDITQECFARLLASEGKVESEANFRNYLFTIAVNICRDRSKLKKEKVHASLNALEESGFYIADKEVRFEETVVMKDAEVAIRKFIDDLPYREKVALYLKKIEGMSYDDVSKITGYSVRSLNRIVKTGLDRLLNRMEKAGMVKGGKLL